MKLTKFIVAAIAVGGVCAGSTFAEEAVAAEKSESSVGAYAYSTFKNGYLSNGRIFYDDNVLQSGAGVTFAGFDLNVWNSYGIGSSYDRKHYGSCGASEIDYELDYAGEIDNIDYMLGVAAWCYPHTDDSFDDLVAKVAVGYNGGFVRPELNARFGLDGQQGCYGQFKLSKGIALTDDEKLSLDLYGLVGYASKSYRQRGWGEDDDGFVDAEFGAELGYAVCDNFSVNCGVTYSVVLDSTSRDLIDAGDTAITADGDTEHFLYYAGISLGF